MPLERSEILAAEGQEEAFAAALKEKIIPILVDTPGVSSVVFGRGVENPDKFIILVDWESLDAHAAFNKGPTCAPFRALFGPYTRGGVMEHFNVG